MVSKLFLGMSLVGAEWVLVLLILLSVLSIALILERILFYRAASKGLEEFRAKIRASAAQGRWEEAQQAAKMRLGAGSQATDLESGLTAAVLEARGAGGPKQASVLSEVAQDPVVRAKMGWEKNLATLATIGANAPFIGLFGTVLGIIKAFHDLSTQGGGGGGAVSVTVTAGMAEALIATAVGILVAIPATVAFNLFQRRVKKAVAEAEAMKSFLIGRIAG